MYNQKRPKVWLHHVLTVDEMIGRQIDAMYQKEETMFSELRKYNYSRLVKEVRRGQKSEMVLAEYQYWNF